jgi:hypothetical protein
MVTRGSIRSTKQEAFKTRHVGRMYAGKFYDIQVAHKSAVAAETLERIAALYAIEKEIQYLGLAKEPARDFAPECLLL